MFVELTRDFLGHKAGTRIDVSEADAKTIVDGGNAKAVVGDPLSETIGKAMAQAMQGITGGMTSAVDAALKDFAAAQTLSRKNAGPRIFGEGNTGDPKKTFGRFLMACKNNDVKTLEEMGSRYVEWDNQGQKTAMSTQTGTLGGFAVPVDFYSTLMGLVSEMSLVRPRATIIPMTGRQIQVPCLDVTTAPSAGDTAFLGGLVARWTEEATTLNETEPTLRQVDLINYELSGYSKISNALMADDAVGLDAMLMTLFSRAIAWYEDYAFLRGNGAGKPLGILTWGGLISVTRSAASAIGLADVAGMYARLLPAADIRKVFWGVHPTTLVKLLAMTGGNNVLMLANQNINDAPRWSILGHEVIVSEKLPALNTAGDILLIDGSHYLIGDRQQIEIAYSEHVAFLTNQAVWRFVSRVGGQPWLRSAVTLSDATSTLSPFVALAAG